MNGDSYVADEGALVLLPPRLLHLVRPLSVGSLEHLVVHFEADRVAPELSRLPLVVGPSRRDSKEAERLFRELAASLSAQRLGVAWNAAGLLLQLLAIYRRSSPGEFEPVELPARRVVEAAASLFQRRFAEPGLSLADAAESAGVSVPYLCRAFKRLTGFTPHRYLSTFRVGRAQLLLTGGTMSCKEVAQATGFSDAAVFNKVFKRIEGVSPARWARRTER